MAALAGAQVVCHPSNIVKPERASIGIRGHALCNGMFIATANRVGAEGDLHFGGMSSVVSPSGEISACAEGDEEVVTVVDIDPQEALYKMLSPRNHLLADRRPEMYGSLVRAEGEE